MKLCTFGRYKFTNGSMVAISYTIILTRYSSSKIMPSDQTSTYKKEAEREKKRQRGDKTNNY